jgi:hypothetical protein
MPVILMDHTERFECLIAIDDMRMYAVSGIIGTIDQKPCWFS